MQTRKPRREDVLELSIDGIDERGHSHGRFEEYSVRVRGAAPGARVRVSVRKRRRSKIEAQLLEVLEPSLDQVAPRCAHFGTCGGCSFQHIEYAAQLELLHRNVVECVAPLAAWVGEGEHPAVAPIIGAEDPWHYRNKMDFTFGSKRWIEAWEPEGAPNGFAVGLHVPGRFDKILQVNHCDIAFSEANAILNFTRESARELGLSAWDVREHTGLLRHLVLRKGVRTNEIMVDLVTTERASSELEPLVAGLLAAHAEITTIVQHVNAGVALVATGEEHVLHGPGHIHEELADLTFRISAGSFFQTNTVQAERLVQLVTECAAVRNETSVFDLYCGSGLFSLALARCGARVVGFELVEAAIEDARLNATRNGVEDVEFVGGDLSATLDADAYGSEPPEVCIVDPPRAGLHATVLEVMCQLGPERIVYVSCNPKSAVRDLETLLAAGYRMLRIDPIDLFPHTPHLECVFTLAR